MRLFSLAACVAIVAGTIIAVPVAPAQANVFCPVTIAAVENLGPLGRQNTFGVLLDFDAGATGSVRMRVDSQTTRYAIDFNDIETIGAIPLRTRRYFTLPVGERVKGAWIESTGTTPDSRLECPITRPYSADAPRPSNPRTVDADKQNLLDNFSSRTQPVAPKPFGKAEARTCAQPYLPPRAILAIQPELPPQARAVGANGSVLLRVALDENSNVVEATVLRSSGFAPLDRAAVAAALKAAYRTETFGCRSVASTYVFTVPFGAAANPERDEPSPPNANGRLTQP